MTNPTQRVDKLFQILKGNKGLLYHGGTDFIALARLPDSDSVERLISDFEALDEVARTDSTFVIERELDSHYPFNNTIKIHLLMNLQIKSLRICLLKTLGTLSTD
nr:Lrp/AsnC ligand binding domain-containing protein [Halolamina pelagica]